MRIFGKRHERHGGTRNGRWTPEYSAWNSMIRRCYDPGHISYSNYGGRGIRVVRRWRDSFRAFLADVGPRPSPKHSLERRKNSRGYSPNNVEWTTRTVQARNTRRNHMITFRGRRRSLAEWAERLMLPYEAVKQRLLLGWSDEAALFTPIEQRKGRPPKIPARRVRAIRYAYACGMSYRRIVNRFGGSRGYIQFLCTHPEYRKDASIPTSLLCAGKKQGID